MAVLTPSQATKSLPWEVRQKWEKRRDSGESSLFLLNSPGSASLLLQLQGYFHIYTQCTICYFPAWLIMKSPIHAGATEISVLHSGNENCDDQEVRATGSDSPGSNVSGSQRGDCGHPHLQQLVIGARLLASAWPGKWGDISKWFINKGSRESLRNVTNTSLWGMSSGDTDPSYTWRVWICIEDLSTPPSPYIIWL